MAFSFMDYLGRNVSPVASGDNYQTQPDPYGFGSGAGATPPSGGGSSHILNDNGGRIDASNVKSMPVNQLSFYEPADSGPANYGARYNLGDGTVMDANSGYVYDPLKQLQVDGDFSKGPINYNGQLVYPEKNGGVQSPFNYPAYTNPTPDQRAAGPMTGSPGTASNNQLYNFNVQAPAGAPSYMQLKPGQYQYNNILENLIAQNGVNKNWNYGEGGEAGSPEFVRNPDGIDPKTGQSTLTPEQRQKNWEQRYYWMQNNYSQMPEKLDPNYVPLNADYNRNNPQALAQLQAIANGQGSSPGFTQEGAARQLWQWQMEKNGAGLEPGSAAHPLGAYHTPDGRIFDVRTMQQVGVDPGSAAHRAQMAATPRFSNYVGGAGGAANYGGHINYNDVVTPPGGGQIFGGGNAADRAGATGTPPPMNDATKQQAAAMVKNLTDKGASPQEAAKLTTQIMSQDMTPIPLPGGMVYYPGSGQIVKIYTGTPNTAPAPAYDPMAAIKNGINSTAGEVTNTQGTGAPTYYPY